MTSIFSRPTPATRTALRFALLVGALGPAGCFDVHTVDPGYHLIDNFDDGYFPADPTFIPWMCFSYNPATNRNFNCAHDTDTPDGSAYSTRLMFTVVDPPDDKDEYGGAGLITYASPGLHEDFSGFSTLVFDVELGSSTPPLPSNAALDVHLGCSTAHLTDGSEPGDLAVLQTVGYTDSWRQVVSSVADFSFRTDDSRRIDGGVAGCLRLVDSIAFEVTENLPDGQSGKGILNIDNVYFK
jgi:hypothetical protein